MRQHALRRGLLLLGSLRLLLRSSHAAALRNWGQIIVLLERDLLALEAGAAATTATTATAVTESTTSTTTATEAATSTTVSEATAAPTATSTTAEPTTTATAATAVVWSAAGKVQADSTTLKVYTLELFDSLLGILDGVEGDVTETLEPSGFPKEELA